MVRNTYSGNGGYGHGTFTLRKPSALRSGEGFLALKLLGCAPLLMHLPLRKGIGRPNRALKKQLAQLIDETAADCRCCCFCFPVGFVHVCCFCFSVVSVFQLFLFLSWCGFFSCLSGVSEQCCCDCACRFTTVFQLVCFSIVAPAVVLTLALVIALADLRRTKMTPKNPLKNDTQKPTQT